MLHRRPLVKSERIAVAAHRRPRHRPYAVRQARRRPGLAVRAEARHRRRRLPRWRAPASTPADVGYVVMGQVLQAGAGQIPSRQVSVGVGLGPTVGSETINKVCASGMRAATLADVLIRAGEHDVIVAGGMESMSNAPYLLPKAPVRLHVRRRRPGRLDDLRRPHVHLRRPDHGRAELAGVGRGRHHPRAAGRVGAAQPRARGRGHRRRPARRRDRAGDRSRPRAATPSSTPTRARAATRPPSAWPRCRPCSRRTARRRPGTRPG